MDVMQALMGQRNPAFRSAAGFSDSPHLFYSGFKPSGDWFLLYQIGFGGVPARPLGDGPDCHCLFPAIKSIPTENIELYFPLIIEANESVPDSGGPGFYRGGNAQRTKYRFLCEGDVSLHDDRWFTKPVSIQRSASPLTQVTHGMQWGVNGGQPGSRSTKAIFRNNSYGEANAKPEILPSKCDYVHVKPGDVLEWVTWGGGGLGDPLTRPAEKVALEVHRRGVTLEGAKRNYGVVVNSRDFSVDKEATEQLRNKIRSGRPADWAELTYNRGGSIEELMKRCKEETSLPSPIPLWEKEPYGPHMALPYVKEWYKKMRDSNGWQLNDYVKL
jgi:5-oxoprolinase (ATP-hydrolysing)